RATPPHRSHDNSASTERPSTGGSGRYTSRSQHDPTRPTPKGGHMARIRTIKPTFFTSLTIANLTLEQRLTFIGLWTHVDDEGRCIYDPRLIKAALWPLDSRTAEDVDGDIRALTESSLITHYTLS